MGRGRWSDSDWKSYSTSHIASKKSVDEIYTSRKLDNSLNPYGVTIRESCDSVDNPESTALIVALDVTGSMGFTLNHMAREGLNTLATEIFKRKPISDPHMMFMAVGDADSDNSPLQVTQFEADIRIAEQLTKIYLEKGGGSNDHESYTLPWYFASMNTKIDCFEKRSKKGYLFTIGDECPPPYLTASQIEKVLGVRPQFDKISSEELLTMVSRQYEVFHLMVEEGNFYRRHDSERVVREWTELLGQRAIKLADHTKMGEVIISIIQATEGESIDRVVSSWDGSTGLVVQKAIDGLTITKQTDGIVRF